MAALASYLMVKAQQGSWLIRIEDLDPPREIKGMADQQIKTLQQLALVSDESIVWQSQRSDLYNQALEYLLQEQKAFYCACSRKQLQSQRGIHQFCQTLTDTKRSSIRLRVPNQVIEFNDGVYGHQQQNLGRDVGDVVLRRADGYYAYQLAVVVDDAEQGITQIVRGADLLDSTIRQIYLQQQLGYQTPSYWHIPLVLDTSGHKLSKSHWAKALDEEDRFAIFCKAYQHLGQNIQVLQRSYSAEKRLEVATQHFDAHLLRATTLA